MSDLEYVALAYGVIWLGLLAYLLLIFLRQARLSREMHVLEQLLRDGEPAEEEEIGPSALGRRSARMGVVDEAAGE